MRLQRVEIVNFRSIEKATLSFDPSCRILVGINESGKSNLIRALSLLQPESTLTADDVREPLPGEDPISRSHVWFVFTFDERDVRELTASIAPKILGPPETPLLRWRNKDLTLREVISRRSGLFVVDLLTKTKKASYFSFDSSYSVIGGWVKPVTPFSGAVNLARADGSTLSLKDCHMVNVDIYPDLPTEAVEPVNIDDIVATIGSEIVKKLMASLPRVITWKYDDRFLLPPTVPMDQFAANPDSCVPLKNMFQLAKITDIRERLTGARSISANALINLLDSVAAKSTAHLRSVWREYKAVQFSLTPNGADIIPAIKERTRSDFGRRSDGFKRFVTFLLMVSTAVKLKEISGCLILIDEPENSLHPSGARYLRDELLKIARSNTVVYSTHSIFMVDQEMIGRHLLVSKSNEKTIVETGSESNVLSEEVIYRALGYSAFETLKLKNVAFEGWRDKQLFRVALTDADRGALLAKKFKDVGVCHVQGVKQVGMVTPIMEMASRELIIVSDADTAATQKKAEFHAQKGFGKWNTYRDLAPTTHAVTSEDFIADTKILKIATEFKAENPAAGDPAAINLSDAGGKMKAIVEWLRGSFPSDVELKGMTYRFKDLLFHDLRGSDLVDEYFEVLAALAKKL